MIWFLVAFGIFLALWAAMYVPDWIRWARWNAKRKRMPEGKRRGVRPPVAPPFWSSYVGPLGSASAGPGGGGGDCDTGGLGGGFGGGGDAGGGGGCD